MKILFVNPRYGYKDGLIILPLDMAYTVAYCRDKGVYVNVIDLAFSSNDDELISHLEKYSYDLVVFTAITICYNYAIVAGNRIKGLINAPPIAIMGEHVTFRKEETLLRHACFNYIVTYEAEQTVVELVTAIVQQVDLGTVKGLSYRIGDKIFHNEDRSPISDLNEIPIPARELFPIAKYQARDYETTMLTSRGCTNKCLFCHRARYGRKLRAWPINRVIDEISQIISLGYSSIFFQDDVFCFDKKRTEIFCKDLIESDINIEWNCNVRLNDFDPNNIDDCNIVSLMKMAGCYRVFIGIESLSQEVLDRNDKRTKIEKINGVVLMFKTKGIQVHASYVIGLPTDTEESIEKTIVMAIGLGTDLVSFNRIIPHPGTPIGDNPELYDIIIPDIYWYEKEYLENTVVAGTSELPPGRIIELQRYAYRKYTENMFDVQ
jgi:anaerobic magnesium-protoporphyrin IX monomethyl ester cyclase